MIIVVIRSSTHMILNLLGAAKLRPFPIQVASTDTGVPGAQLGHPPGASFGWSTTGNSTGHMFPVRFQIQNADSSWILHGLTMRFYGITVFSDKPCPTWQCQLSPEPETRPSRSLHSEVRIVPLRDKKRWTKWDPMMVEWSELKYFKTQIDPNSRFCWRRWGVIKWI